MADFRNRDVQYRRARRKAKAISFLSNISLHGNSHKSSSPHDSQETKEENDSDEKERNRTQGSASGSEQHEDFANANNAVRKGVSVSVRVSVNQDTPVQRQGQGVRRSFSFGRIRRTSGDSQTPPSSPAKLEPNAQSSELLKHRYQKQISADPSSFPSSHGSHEDTPLPVRSRSVVNDRSYDDFRDLSPTVRFLKSHKQLRRNGRIIMVSHHKAPFAIFSHLAYSKRSQFGHLRRDSESTPTSHRVRVSSGGKQKRRESIDFSSVKCIEGVELGDEGKTVSYSHMLVPTFHRKYVIDPGASQGMAMRTQLMHLKQAQNPREKLKDDGELAELMFSMPEYDPNQLDDPELIAGKHKKLFTFESYMVSIIDYAKPSELKREINQKFKERFPRIDLSLSKLRSIKREMRKIAIDECGLDPGVLAQSYVFFEKLVLYEKVNKGNRKLLAGVCLVLAAKLNDIKGADLQNVIKETEDVFRESRKDLLAFEFPVLVALEFALHIREQEVMPHYRRIIQQ